MAKRARKESPLPFKERALNSPADSTQRRLFDVFLEQVLFPLILASLFVLVAALEWFRYARPTPPSPWILTILAVPAVAFAVFRIRRALLLGRNLQTGIAGETLIGHMLEELRDAGYRVLHDIPGEGFNVDHVAVGPGGVFAIETKTRRKRRHGNKIEFDGEQILVNGFAPDRDPIRQARANADFIRDKIAERTGRNATVQPVVVFPGWWVEEERSPGGVWVLNEKRMMSFIRHQRPQLSKEDILMIAAALSHHVRTFDAE